MAFSVGREGDSPPLPARLKWVPRRGGREFQISDIGAEAEPDARANGHHDNIIERQSRHPQSPHEIRRPVYADKTLIDRVRSGKAVDQHHGARPIAAEIEAKRWALPIDPQVARILGVQDALPI